jgi:hypothetical protein
MNPNNTIRIVKRAQQQGQGAVAETRAAKSENPRQATREVAGQVTSWIKEFQQSRKAEARRTFASLFVDVATTQLG